MWYLYCFWWLCFFHWCSMHAYDSIVEVLWDINTLIGKEMSIKVSDTAWWIVIALLLTFFLGNYAFFWQIKIHFCRIKKWSSKECIDSWVKVTCPDVLILRILYLPVFIVRFINFVQRHHAFLHAAMHCLCNFESPSVYEVWCFHLEQCALHCMLCYRKSLILAMIMFDACFKLTWNEPDQIVLRKISYCPIIGAVDMFGSQMQKWMPSSI